MIKICRDNESRERPIMDLVASERQDRSRYDDDNRSQKMINQRKETRGAFVRENPVEEKRDFNFNDHDYDSERRVFIGTNMGTRRKSTTSVTRESRSPAVGGSSKTASSMTKYSRSPAGGGSSETASSVTRDSRSSAGVRSSKAASDWSSLRDETPRDWSSMMERITRAGVRLTRVEERCSR